MPTKRTKATDKFDELLGKIPKEAKSVLICTATGQKKYKAVEELTDKDDIQVNKAGEPIIMKGSPGRPKAVVMEPATRMAAEIIRLKQDVVKNDAILKVARDNPEDPDFLQQVVLQLAEEAASIGFERTRAEQAGEKTSELSVRHINALKALADTWLKRKDQLSTRGIDMDSAAFQVLLKFMVQTFRESMLGTGARDEVVNAVFARLAKDMGDDWKAEARNRMKQVV